MDHDELKLTTPFDSTAVVRAFREPLRRFLARRVDSSSDVDDLLQDVFVRIAERRDELDEVEHMSGWLYRIARNAVVDHHRARGRIGRVAAGRDPESESVDVQVSSAEQGRELADCLPPIVARMTDPYREAVTLTELDGLTQSEAAARVGISLSGMKSRVQRGREQLRTLVLECCDVELDRRRGVSDFEPKSGGCRPDDCGCRSLSKE